MYISASELKAFYPNLTALVNSDVDYLEDNIIARTKKAIDRYCFTSFDTVPVTDEKYLDIQLAQKLLAGKLFIRETESAKIARESVGNEGSENRGDWSYKLSQISSLFDEEIKNILDKYRDWSQADAQKAKPKTGTIVLEGDPLYDYDIKG